MKSLRVLSIVLIFLLVSGFTECYKPVTNSGLPKHIKTIAVPAFQFEAKGLRYRIESRFTEAVTKEVIKRGNGLKVQGTPDGADAVVEGTIRDFAFTGVLLDRDGRARVYEVTVVAAVTIRDLKEKKILYDNQNFIFRDSYEFSEDPRSFFNEEDP
ncbi:MAG: LptE family protein, partial [Saprospiraceae bacterium]|nr:LptE family protein [Pyrinomonadaceae bacterium]